MAKLWQVLLVFRAIFSALNRLWYLICARQGSNLNPMIRNQVDTRRFKDALGGMKFNWARRPNVVPGNMGGCQFVILAERGLTAIVDGFDIPALG